LKIVVLNLVDPSFALSSSSFDVYSDASPFGYARKIEFSKIPDSRFVK